MKYSKDDLQRFRGQWRDQVFADPKVSPAACRVAYCLAGYMTMTTTRERYEETGRIEVFPSYESLVRGAYVSEDTVRVSLRTLIDRGHLDKIKRGNQVNGSNVYRVLIPRKTIEKYRPSYRGISAMLPRKFRDADP